MIQRVLAAKDGWHARMGIVLAMFMKVFLPVMIVLPGLIYFAMDPGLTEQTEIDKTYAKLVTQLVNAGLKGLLLAALFGAIQSTIDSVLNSTSTVITLDIYRKFIRPQASEKQLAGAGIWLSTAILLIAVLLAPQIARLGQGVFFYIQNLYAHFAPPFAAIFVVGLLWKRATGKSAVATIFFGIAASLLLEYVVFKLVKLPVAFSLRASIVWGLCVVFQVIVSLLTRAPAPENVTPDLVFDWRTTRLFTDLGTPWYRNLALWYGAAAAGMIGCYVAFSGLFFR
jgi:SSS family solute:Na+ symporter